MKNFSFHNPTRIVFGKDCVAKLNKFIPEKERVLVCFGGGSVRSNGVYNQVKATLSGYTVHEFWGIEPNPSVETVRAAVAEGKSFNATCVLAVGGGSVLDACKLIAAALTTDADPWEITRAGVCKTYLPLYTVLTVPATGSEMNSGAVISNKATGEKFPVTCGFPVVSFMDPSFCLTLGQRQRACGIADAYVHVLEQYLTFSQSGIMDRMAEGVLKQLIDIAPKCVKEELDYDTASEYMLTATIALNGFLGMGVVPDWATHFIGHEITALTSITHAETLTMILPHLWYVLLDHKQEKLAQYARRVWHITDIKDERKLALRAIERTVKFFRDLGLATSMLEKNVDPEVGNEIIERFYKRNTSLGEGQICTPELIEAVIRRSQQVKF